MSIRIHTIRHTIMGKKIDKELPVIFSQKATTLEGYMDIRIGSLASIGTPNAYVFKVQPPSETEDRYIRLEPNNNLYTTYPDCLYYEIKEHSTGRVTLFWRVYLDAIPGIALEDYYSVEFEIVEPSDIRTAGTASIRGGVIVQVNADIS